MPEDPTDAATLHPPLPTGLGPGRAPVLDPDLLHAILMDMHAGLAVADLRSGHLILLNRKAQDIFGAPVPGTVLDDWLAARAAFHADGRRFGPNEWPTARVTSGLDGADVLVLVETPEGGRRLRVSATLIAMGPGRPAVLALFNEAAGDRRADAACAAVDLVAEPRRHHAHTSATLHEVERMAEIGNFSLSIEDRSIYWSDQMFVIYGIGRDEIPRSWEDFLKHVHADDRAKLRLRSEEIDNWQVDNSYRIVRPDGEIRHIHERSFIECDPDGRPVRVFGINQDVTRQVRAEAALRAAKEEFQRLFDNAVDGIFRADFVGRILMANPSFVRLCGFDAWEALEANGFRLGPEIHVDRASYDAICAGLRSVGAVKDYVFEVLQPGSGERRWVSLSAKVMRDGGGPPRRYEATIRDITEPIRAQEAVARSQRHLDRAQAIAAIGSWERDIDVGTAIWSDQCYRVLGIRADRFDPSRDDVTALIHPEDRETYQTWRERLIAGQRAGGIELRILRADDGVRYARLEGEPFDDGTRRIVGTVQDITERVVRERALQEAHALQRAILDSSGQIIVATDNDNIIRSVNRAGERLLGYDAAELVGQASPLIFHDPEEVEARRAAMSQDLGRELGVWEYFMFYQGGKSRQEWTYVRKDGVRFPVELFLTPMTDDWGTRIGLLGVASDISERKAYERQLLELATRDGLTGLWNRRHFMTVAEQTFHTARRYQRPAAVMLFDIDHFKRINDGYGHDAGDAVLRAVAGMLPDTLRRSDLCCRWGGEEFAVLLPETLPEDALQVAERLRQAVAAMEVPVGSDMLRVSISIGLADWDPEEEFGVLVRRADQALYRAKAAGRDCVHCAWMGDRPA